MIQIFPIAHQDELLGSVLARFRDRMGLEDDKVVLDLLFGSRTVVPSAIMQGHVEQLLAHVGHLWPVDARHIIEKHSVLPVHRPFVPEARYRQLLDDLERANQNPVTLRSGLNASILQWPNTYKICPLCWRDQICQYGYAYWQRTFQCPGVECCPGHGCTLIDTSIPLSPIRRHRFVGTRGFILEQHLGVAAPERSVVLAGLIRDLLSQESSPLQIGQWSSFYAWLARHTGNTRQGVIDHESIRESVLAYWGEPWLTTYGLDLRLSNNWLLAMFRSHRRPFTYLQHFVVWMALLRRPFTIAEVIAMARRQPVGRAGRADYFSSKADERRDQYRAAWLSLLASPLGSLKAIRATREGGRLYSWLYRFDHDWLQSHKPKRVDRVAREKVCWVQRDRVLVRNLLAVERLSCEDLGCPRRTVAWFARRVGVLSRVWNHIDKLPLCRMFFDRYAESVDEYQVRRLTKVMMDLIGRSEQGLAVHAIERLAGLSTQRCRPAARAIIDHCIRSWQRYQQISFQCKAQQNR